MIIESLNKDNLHHAYLIEGDKDKILPELLEFIEKLGVKQGSADFSQIELDTFKVEDARNLKSYAMEKGFSAQKKIFIISANSFLLEAQNTLLKVFEEPIENTHFFVIVPDTNAFIKTFVSRFYLILARQDIAGEKDVDKFIQMSLQSRIDFLQELLPKKEKDEEEEITTESNRSKALKFLNSLESALHKGTMSKRHFDMSFFEHIFKVRKFLRMPGSSTKTLMESVALVVPTL